MNEEVQELVKESIEEAKLWEEQFIFKKDRRFAKIYWTVYVLAWLATLIILLFGIHHFMG